MVLRCLYISPCWETNQDKFVEFLSKAYSQMRLTVKSDFVNLSILREIVCYNMKISSIYFEKMLETAYTQNLTGQLKIRISLEVDRLPEETNAIYLKREPVTILGDARNIIAIDFPKGV